jgi:phage terminase small subunit
VAVLKNARWEKFAQEVALGKSATEAYLAAGFVTKSKVAKVNAHKLRNRPEVDQRIDELMGWKEESNARAKEIVIERMADKIAGTREWIIDRLVENVERAMQARQATDGEGNPVGEFKYDGGTANKALELLGKEVGMFVDRTENLNVQYGIADEPMTPDEWAKKHASAPEKKLN